MQRFYVREKLRGEETEGQRPPLVKSAVESVRQVRVCRWRYV